MTPPVGALSNRLSKVRLHNVSLVDRPAAQHASVVLFKSEIPPSILDFRAAFAVLKTSPKQPSFSNLTRALARRVAQ